MIGALLLKHGVTKEGSANIESRDAAQLTAGFSEDVVITFPGKEPIVGREAAQQFFQGRFDQIVDEKLTIKAVALVHPYAVGLSNTVLEEVEITATYKDGHTVTGREVYAQDFDGKELKALRFYIGDLAFLDSDTQAT